MIEERLLKSEEKAIFSLRELYRKNGYLPFKMSKFEEYDMYVRNKDFLIGDSAITFNDTDGRLLALKPDVTLSIIKNATFVKGQKNRVYYNENVYRVSGSTHRFKEIMQTGLECIGDIDIYDISEVTYLAAKSLCAISDKFVLDISHMGIFSAILDEITEDKMFKKEITSLIAEKNRHEVKALCGRFGVSSEQCEMLLGFIDMYGSPRVVLPKIKELCVSEKAAASYEELSKLTELLSGSDLSERINIDFSAVSNMKYYNGIVFKGFLDGIYESVLSGGEYRPLMQRMGKGGSGIGFALYLDLLEGLCNAESKVDVDVLLLYSEKTDTGAIISKKKEILASGKSVSVQKTIPEKIRYSEIVDMDKEDSE